MRDTVHCLVSDADTEAITESVEAMVGRVQAYVPGYRLKQKAQFESVTGDDPLRSLLPANVTGDPTKVSVFLEVEGAAHYLPSYAGNLDIMTSAALRTAERIAEHRTEGHTR
jgi:acetaldehyde dehydrogenase